MKRVLQIVALSLLATLAVLVVMALLLPNRYHVQRSIMIAAAPAVIHPWVEDLRQWQKWANYNRDEPSLVVEYDGPAQGVGAIQRWRGDRTGSGSVTITQSDPGQGVVFSIELGDGTVGVGSVRYSEAQGLTTVTWTDDGQLPNLMGGFFRGDFEDLLGHHFDEGLRRLKRTAESQSAR